MRQKLFSLLLVSCMLASPLSEAQVEDVDLDVFLIVIEDDER